MSNVNTVFMQLPTTIKSYVVANGDMTYTIVLNCNLNHEQNLLAYAHELWHIQNGDYDKKCSVDMIEIVAHENINHGGKMYEG